MAKKKSSLTKSYDGLPLIIRVLLQIFLGFLVTGIYRIVRYLESKNVTTLLVGIISLLTGGLFGILWIIDLVTLIINKKYTVLVA